MKKLFIIFLCVLPMLASAGVKERSLAKDLVTAYMENHGNAEKVLKKPPIDITERTRVCGLCHGPEGNSKQANVPSLAAQNPVYFVEQLLVFKNKGRYPKMMHEMVNNLDEESMIVIALHYSKIPRNLTMEVNEKLGNQGKKLYADLCSHCHGEIATGSNDTYANLRAQRPDYLITTIKRFRNNDAKRSSHVMGSAVKGMSDEEISALANYIAGL